MEFKCPQSSLLDLSCYTPIQHYIATLNSLTNSNYQPIKSNKETAMMSLHTLSGN